MVLQYGHSILVISVKCLSIISILFSCNSFLLFSFVVLNVNHNAAIVMAMNIAEKIRIICQADVAAICFILTRDLSVSRNDTLNVFLQPVSG